MRHPRPSLLAATRARSAMLAAMEHRRLHDALARADETRTASLMVRANARREREAWRAWRAVWATLERDLPTERMLTVCMYCERFCSPDGDWAAIPRVLADLLQEGETIPVQVTHGVCPLCLAAHLEENGP
jgi:hypothetical protein